jgi:alkanesulfonate monooxygenase SsuD/methylene tetrahydromethanopterin reductase-like flavin-dependent oxidoreductase (luciferase family)
MSLSEGEQGTASTMGAVDIGVYVPQVGFTWDDILQRATLAEALGLHSLWFYDHLYAPGLPGFDSLEGWTLAAYVLASTARLRAGHLVLCNNFRHPALVAKMVATLDVCSGGRLEVGIGSGSVEAEHHQAGFEWGTAAERADRLDEAVALLSALITVPEGEERPPPVSAEGRYYTIRDLPNRPGPVQRPRPPLHIGGVGHRRTLPLVARHADVWNVPTYGLGRWREHRAVLDDLCSGIGRDPATLRRSHQAVLVLAPDDASLAEARAVAERRYGDPLWGLDDGGYIGTPAQVVDRIGRSVEEGISLFVFFTHDRADPRTLELLAQEVVPAFA